jgi:hypothetical protein
MYLPYIKVKTVTQRIVNVTKGNKEVINIMMFYKIAWDIVRCIIS